MKFYQNIIINYLEVLKTPINIRALYLPVQPGFKHPLADPFHYKVIADGCIKEFKHLYGLTPGKALLK